MSHDTIWLIHAPVPPILERALGYYGTARFVTFFWNNKNSKLWYLDEYSQLGSGSWVAWWVYCTHPKLTPYLKPFEIVNNAQVTSFCILLDRTRRLTGITKLNPPSPHVQLSSESHLFENTAPSECIVELVQWLG